MRGCSAHKLCSQAEPDTCCEQYHLRSQAYMGNTRNEEQNTRILFRFGLFCEYSNLEYVRIHAIYRVNQAGYAIHIPADAPPEYVNMYSPRRVSGLITVTRV